MIDIYHLFSELLVKVIGIRHRRVSSENSKIFRKWKHSQRWLWTPHWQVQIHTHSGLCSCEPFHWIHRLLWNVIWAGGCKCECIVFVKCWSLSAYVGLMYAELNSYRWTDLGWIDFILWHWAAQRKEYYKRVFGETAYLCTALRTFLSDTQGFWHDNNSFST